MQGQEGKGRMKRAEWARIYRLAFMFFLEIRYGPSRPVTTPDRGPRHHHHLI
jgi:hypothetical protein